MEPVFLTVELVIAIHADQIGRYGGTLGIRDRGGLESAVAQASATFAGELLHPSLCDQAAAYLFHLAQNHPFLDGNKRVGTASALVFLNLNGLDFRAEVEGGPLFDLTVAVATGRADKVAIAQHFNAWLL